MLPIAKTEDYFSKKFWGAEGRGCPRSRTARGPSPRACTRVVDAYLPSLRLVVSGYYRPLSDGRIDASLVASMLAPSNAIL